MLTAQEVVFSTSPYPGLRSFLSHEADIFFGREEQVDELLRRLQSTRFLAVVGTSGCGKSSLVKAGMIPALGAGFLTEAGTRWCVAEMRPGEAPFDRLTTTLLSALDWAEPNVSTSQTESFVRAALRRGPLGLVEAIRERGLADRANLLLVVDQFEEIFRFHREGNADEADAFVNLLLTSCAQAEFPVYVVLTMRSDFLGECALFDGLPQALNNNQFLAPRLSRKECEAVIVKPARVFGGDVEPLLVNHLLNDMGIDSDQLPLLQHALMRMWERTTEADGEPEFRYDDGPVLKLADYKAIGGLKDALSLHADEVYGEFDLTKQKIIESLFRRLTERGVGKRDIRRPTRLGELAEVASASIDDIKTIIEAFRRSDRSFLMPPPPIPLNQDTIIDIGHESLIRQWHRLNGWVTTEAESARLYRRLAEDALLHEQGKTGYLTDPQLQIALDWYDRNQPNQAWANRYSEAEFSQVKVFLEASQNERKKTKWRRWALFAVLGTLALIMIAVTVFAVNQRNNLDFQAKIIVETRAEIATKTSELSKKNCDLEQQICKSDSLRDLAVDEKNKADSLKYLADEQVIKIQKGKKKLKISLNSQINLTKKIKAEADRNLLHLSGLISLEKGQLDSAKIIFTTLANSITNEDSLSKWWIFYNLGSICHKSKDFFGAQTNYYLALSYLNENNKKTAIERAITLYKQAQWYRDKDVDVPISSAEGSYQTALELLKKYAVKDSTEDYRINIEVNLAGVKSESNRREEAKDLYRSALNKLIIRYGKDNTRTLEITDKLVQLYINEQSLDDYIKAKKLLKDEERSMVKRFKPDYHGLAPIYRDLAFIYDYTGKHSGRYINQSLQDTAITLRNISQKIVEKNLNISNREETRLEDLQKLYTAYNLDYAEQLHESELEIRRNSLSPGSAALAAQILQFANFYSSVTEEFRKSEPLYVEALTIQKSLLANSRVRPTLADSLLLQHTLEDFGDLLSRTSRNDSALALYNRVNAFREHTYGVQSPILTNNLKKMADLYLLKGDIAMAATIYNNVIEIWQPLLGPKTDKQSAKSWWNTKSPSTISAASEWGWLEPDSYIASLMTLGSMRKREQGALELYERAKETLTWIGNRTSVINDPGTNVDRPIFYIYVTQYAQPPFTQKEFLTPLFYRRKSELEEKLRQLK